MASSFDSIALIAAELSIKPQQVKSTANLLSEGATIPFISRYRKEMTGSLDEVQVESIAKLVKRFAELDQRREAILKSIAEQEKLTPELQERIEAARDSRTLEDLYLPYKSKRKTRADKAKEAGLLPLAGWMMKQEGGDPISQAKRFVGRSVDDVEAALQGARDIMAEWMNEREAARSQLRRLFGREAVITSKLIKGKEEEAEKYRDYFDFSEPLKRCRSHRLMAIRRGEQEGVLRVSISPDSQAGISILERIFVRGRGAQSDQVLLAAQDAYKRLLKPSIETEFRKSSAQSADEEAIRVFATNLRQLLLAPPLGGVRTLAIDPGFKSGCKLVCLDNQGELLHNETIFPHPPQRKDKDAMRKISSLVDAYKIESIAIGNGTAGRETEALIKRMRFDKEVKVFIVNEDGASVYSASSVGREEFPQFDVTVRGAVSIGRRLMDPLAELVKIEPKSLGVGQYQHDVDQNALQETLDRVVESCVNQVGVDLNTASYHLLAYVSGIGPKLARNIVTFRDEEGAFSSRKQLQKVKGLGAKSCEQCSGFLRIADAKNPLDNSAVHPERYPVVEKMAKDLSCQVQDLLRNADKRKQIDIDRYVSEGLGRPTLEDILSELEKPGRDPRSKVKIFEFDPNLRSIEDVRAGMVVPGIVNNITNFGAFVDIGIKQGGLIHVSQMADRFIRDPNEIVHLNQHLKVRVVEVDQKRGRIQLSLKDV